MGLGRRWSLNAVDSTPVAQSQSGKWVARVASTGGGRTYKKQRPTNFYAAIAVIVVLGLLSIVFSRHQYQSGSTTTTTSVAIPAIGSTTFAGLSIEACGTVQPTLAVQTDQTGSLVAQADGVVKVAPKTAAQAGANSNVARFATSYKGLSVTSKKLVVPANGSTAGLSYANGATCPVGTPDAGKIGVVSISRWTNFATKKPSVSTDPAKVKLSASALVTISFGPKGSAATKPGSATVQAMLAATNQQQAAAAAAATSTTTTAPMTGTTTVTSTLPVTTTSAPAATTVPKTKK